MIDDKPITMSTTSTDPLNLCYLNVKNISLFGFKLWNMFPKKSKE